MRKNHQREPDPTAAEIKARAAEVRATWSEADHRRRAMGPRALKQERDLDGYWTPPVVSTADLSVDLQWTWGT